MSPVAIDGGRDSTEGISLAEFAVMNGLLLDRSYEVGGVVAVVHGPLSGIRGVVIRITDDDKVVIRLDESGEVFLVVAAENIAANLPPRHRR